MTAWMDEYLDAWNSRDAARVASFMADDGTYEDLALGVVHKGREEIAAFVLETAHFSSDYRIEAVSEQSDGDSYAMEWEMYGTNTGDGGGLPATNKPYRIRGVSVGRRNAEGKITQNRDYWNMADYLVQVGILPPPGGAA